MAVPTDIQTNRQTGRQTRQMESKLSSRGVKQGWGGVTCSWGDGADDGCPGVPAKAGLQHPSQLAVPEGHMAPALQYCNKTYCSF